MARASAPIEAEASRSMPKRGTGVIVSTTVTPQAHAIADALKQQGLSVIVTDAKSLIEKGDTPRDLAALIVVLPSVGTSFLGCAPAEFDERVEGLATQLFQVFRWALAARSSDDPPLCGLVLRPVADHGSRPRLR